MPEQIYPGESFANGQQVDAFRLNNHVGNAVLLPGAIAEQNEIDVQVVSPSDKFLVLDETEGALRKISLGNILNTGTSSKSETSTVRTVEAYPQNDINLKAYAGPYASGAFTSTGVFVTVYANLSGITAGCVVEVSSITSGISGIFLVISSNSTSFTYRLLVTGAAVSGNCSFRKTSTVFVSNGNFSANGNIYAFGTNYTQGSTICLGDTTISGNLRFGGNKIPITLEDLSKTYVKSGQATGSWTSTTDEKIVYQTPTLPTPPAGETWIYTIVANFTGGDGRDSNTRCVPNVLTARLYKNAFVVNTQSFSAGTHHFTGTSVNFSISITSVDVNTVIALKATNGFTLTENPWWTVTLNKIKTSSLSDASTCI